MYVQIEDIQLKEAIKTMVMSTWQTNKVGIGHDADGLSHRTINILKMKQNENHSLYKHYDTMKREHCTKVVQGQMSVASVADLDGGREVMTANQHNAQLNSHCLKEIGEYYLYHGCPSTNDTYKAILEDGPDPRLSGEGMFGRGVYLAESPVKADQYVGESAAYLTDIVLTSINTT